MFRKDNNNSHKGFSLIELIIVIALIGILLNIATFQFSQYSKKSAIENQTKTLYDDILNLGNRAFYEKRSKALVMDATGYSYSIYSTNTTTATPVSTTSLRFQITNNGPVGQAKIVFNDAGLGLNNQLTMICINTANQAQVDSIMLYSTSVRIGKNSQSGASCDATNFNAM